MDGEVPSVMLFIISLLGPTYNGNFQAPLSQYQTYGIITPRNLSIARTILSPPASRIIAQRTRTVSNRSS
jgi:hypothetical protein